MPPMRDRRVRWRHGSTQLTALTTLLALTAQLTSAVCPAANSACTIEDVMVSGEQLFAQLTDATSTLTVRNVRLTDWPVGAIRSTGRAAQLRSLQLNNVTWTAATAPPRLGGDSDAQALLTRLSRLQMSGGGRTCPFSGIVGLRQLSRLAVAGCKVGSLNAAWLRNLPSLSQLTVDSARVDSVQLATVDQATRASLVEIRLKNNSFNTLTKEAFGNMPSLARLILEDTIVQYIQPGAFERLPQLQELSIVLPKEGQLAKIWDTSLAGRFENNTQLEILRLANARLAEDQVTSSFEPLKQLRRLDLRGHRFKRLHNGVLSTLASLEWLDLSDGSLVCLFDRNFGVLGRLRRLNLARNNIRVIGQRALLGLQSLERLDLTGNPIQTIEVGAFCSLPPAVKASPSLLTDWELDASAVEGAANITDPCPADFNPNKLILSTKPQCLEPKSTGGSASGADGSGQQSGGQQSRHTFLIIIGLCVAFLLITVISMMAYKGWSKRKNAQLAKDEEKELELQAMVAAAEDGGGGVSNDGAGGKRPENGARQQHHHQQRHHHAKKSSAGPSADAAGSGGGTPTEEAAAAAAGTNGEIETKAQVESPERGQGPEVQQQQQESAGHQDQDSTSSSSQPRQPQQQQQPRPGVTPMTTVPEDSDLEARAITTLVVV